MTPSSRSSPTDQVTFWLQRSRGGDPEALGQALDACRDYLLMVANGGLPDDLRAKGGASDVVQETFLDAYKHADGFDGASAGELLAWLTTILRSRLANFQRDFRGTAKRQVSREV